ncbi:MAG: ABC transporter ATP-binding protein [Oscillospiraceae bacterium]|nr:ABC transporter ATP-binding protein [Oscillospiraceae bacterium]
MSIEVRSLNFSYGPRQVLRDIIFDIEPAQTLAILGPNGSGKTTLLNIIVGSLAQTSGSIIYEGKTFKHFNPRKMAQLVGYVPQTIIPVFDYSVIDYVVTGCAPQIGTFERPQEKHYDIAMKYIREMGIEHLAEKSYRQISGGERQQVSIARALAQCPTYILMDEPTSHLDFGNQIRVLKTIRQLAQSGFGVVFTTHNPDHALLVGGKAAIIDRSGKLTFGNSHQLINEALLSELYGVALCIKNIEGSDRKICFAPYLSKGENEYEDNNEHP